ncbi:MAG: hypothetical protein E7315_06250 [Clostridiales bacterium]|nr:hypothetical protein [Clostridiales bacterium]
MKDLVKYDRLFSIYKGMLTKCQYEYMSMYYTQDYSLVEIAELHNVTKQSVAFSISQAEKKLVSLEKKLKFNELLNKTAGSLENVCKKLEENGNTQAVTDIREIVEDLL